MGSIVDQTILAMATRLRNTLLIFLAFTYSLSAFGQAKRPQARRSSDLSYVGTPHTAELKARNVFLKASEDRTRRKDQSPLRPQVEKSSGDPIGLPNRLPQARETILGPTRVNAFGTINVTSDLPPNTDMAVSGNGLVVTVDNDYLSIWDTNGDEVLVETWLDFFNNLSAPLGGEILFPRVAIDPVTGRFVVAVNYGETGSDASLFLLISETDDPSLGWLVYEVFSSEWQDSGTLTALSVGISTEEIFVTADVVDDFQDQVDVVIFQMDKEEAFAGQQLGFLFYQDFVDFDDDLGSHLHATQYDFNATVGSGMYFVSRTEDYVLLWDITGAIDDTGTQLDLYEYAAESYTFKPQIEQLGSTDVLFGGNGQVSDALYADDYLYLVH
ncbi:MAG TPA: hypothetical protein DCP28_37535, partial [Cytophagales bacterium]|nr:hypothetical protein [Cytophagales bacterium]